MKKHEQLNKTQLNYAVAFTVGVGLAIGASIGNYIVGLLIAFPLGAATYFEKANKKNN